MTEQTLPSTASWQSRVTTTPPGGSPTSWDTRAAFSEPQRHFGSKYEVEKHIVSLDVPYTIIAPVFFMDNLLQPWALQGLRQGKLAMAMPATRSLQQIAVVDIGGFTAAVVERRESAFGQRIDIAGDELTGDEAVAILSKLTGGKSAMKVSTRGLACPERRYGPHVRVVGSHRLCCRYQWPAPRLSRVKVA